MTQWRCDNSHYWDVTPDAYIIDLWHVEGDGGTFLYAGTDTRLCPLCLAPMGQRWDIPPTMPLITPLVPMGATR